jgi:competence ComEA-like helix-hairpin-helix protein
MNAFRRVRDLFTFTKNEQKIFLFLSVIFLIGAGIKAYRIAVDNPEETRFDYTQSDSVFHARSAPSAIAAGGPGSGQQKKIDLNTAARAELMQLPGVGESTAARIVRYRAEHGPLKSEAELRRVKGIGPKKFEQLRPFITVGKDKKKSVTINHHPCSHP